MIADLWDPFALVPMLMILCGLVGALVARVHDRRARPVDSVVYKSRADWLRDIYADVSLEVIHARILRSGGASILKKEFAEDDGAVGGAGSLLAALSALAAVGSFIAAGPLGVTLIRRQRDLK